MIAGHAYYFLEDVYPRMTGRRPLKTPSLIKALFADDPVVVARPANVRFAAPQPEELHQDWMIFVRKYPAKWPKFVIYSYLYFQTFFRVQLLVITF